MSLHCQNYLIEFFGIQHFWNNMHQLQIGRHNYNDNSISEQWYMSTSNRIGIWWSDSAKLVTMTMGFWLTFGLANPYQAYTMCVMCQKRLTLSKKFHSRMHSWWMKWKFCGQNGEILLKIRVSSCIRDFSFFYKVLAPEFVPFLFYYSCEKMKCVWYWCVIR